MTLSQAPTASHQYIRPSADMPSVQSYEDLRRSSNSWLSMTSASNGNGIDTPSTFFRIGSALSRRASLQPSRSTPNTSNTRTRTSFQEPIRENHNNHYCSAPDSNRWRLLKQKKRESTQVERRARPTPDDLYCAQLSVAAREFRRRMNLSDRVKNGIEYKDVFDGKEAVDTLMEIIGTRRRDLARRLGIALGAQRVFHDVDFESRLVDSVGEIYQYYDEHDFYAAGASDSSVIVSTVGSIESESRAPSPQEDPQQQQHQMPNGIFTPLTYCYTPLCIGEEPCYSISCPKRELLRPRTLSIDHRLTRSTTHAYMRLQEQPLWSTEVAAHLSENISPRERRRQETIYELIYTESNFVKDVEYVNKMWIQPLLRKDIIPGSRRESFIEKVFYNIMAIHQVNRQFLSALRARQNESPIVSQIGDVILDFVVQLEPFVLYGARLHEAKYAIDAERLMNPKFATFYKETENHPSALRLELDGYLSKPTTRLSRYSLFFDAILKQTPNDHPDKVNIPKATGIVESFLERVNEEHGKAKNRFDLERIEQNIVFKVPKVDLDLLNENRVLVKQIKFCKSPGPNPGDYLVLLFDHYLVMTKVKIVNNQETYVVKQRPIPIELLQVTLPNAARRTNSILPPLSPSGLAERRESASLGATPSGSLVSPANLSYPITFQHIGQRNSTPTTLYASARPIPDSWVQQIKRQQDIKAKRRHVFSIIPAIQEHRFIDDARVNHITTFNNGQQYVLATDEGVYVGHTGPSSKPHKVLSIPKVTQVQVLEEAQLLLVLAERTLYEYQLTVVNGRPGDQFQGHAIKSNVPFFHVGTSLGKQLVCIPRVSALNSNIATLEPSRPNQDHNRHFFPVRKRTSQKIHLKDFKVAYIPGEAWAVELTASKMLITCPRGIMMVDMKTDQTQQMLNPSDKSLSFVTEREKNESRLSIRGPIKHIAVFRTVRGDHLVCYDEYAFYIDSKGNRSHPKFRIEFEGAPEAYAYSHPYVLAFEPNFIEIRNVLSGELEQIIRGRNIRCLNNGYKAENPFIFGVMDDPTQASFQYIFQLVPLAL